MELYFFSLLLAAASPAPQTKLNGPLPRQIVSSIRAHEFSPDGASVVYLADEREDERYELFAVPADGSAAPIVLSGTLVAGGDVGLAPGVTGSLASAFEVAPDSSWVAFLADAEVDGVQELLRAPIDGSSAPLVLARAVIGAGDVQSFAIAPDGQHVIALADGLVDERFELWSVPADGSALPVRISAPLVSGGDVKAFEIGARSERLYYLADATLDGVVELFSVALAPGSPVVRLNAPLPAGRTVTDFRVQSDEARVLFRADVTIDEDFELRSVPADGSALPVRLDSGSGDVSSYELVEPAGRVVFLHSGLGPPSVASAPLDGSSAGIQLTDPGERAVGFWVTPDGATVLYRSRASTAGQDQDSLRSVPVAGGPTTTLAAPTTPNTTILELELAPAGDLAVFTWDSAEFNGYNYFHNTNLYRVSLAGGPVVPLTSLAPSSLTFEEIASPKLVEQGEFVLYRRNERSGLGRLHLVRTDGSVDDRVLAPATGTVLSPDRARQAFVETHGRDAGRLIGMLAGGDGRVPLSSPALLGAVNGDVSRFSVTPDGLQVVHVSFAPGNNSQAFLVGSGGGTAPVDLLATDELVTVLGGPYFGPRSERAVFVLERLFERTDFLYSVPLRSRAAGVKIEAPGLFAEPYSFVRPQFTPDGKHFVFAATSLDADRAIGLYRVASDGSSAPVRLNGNTLDRALNVSGNSTLGDAPFELTPDGTHVVYSAGPTGTVLQAHNLFCVRLDPPGAPLQLTDFTLPFTGPYWSWRLTPDGSRAIYLGSLDGVQGQLFSVPSDASAPPLRLNPDLVAQGNVLGSGSSNGFRRYAKVTPDGSRVLYLADQEVDERVELYSVPVDGSAPATKLSGTLVPGGDVAPLFELTPDGARVLFRADKSVNDTLELYSAPVDGSAASVKLSGTTIGPLASYSFSSGLRTGPGRVAFVLLHGSGAHLYSSSFDGSAPRLRLDTGLTDPEAVLFEQGQVAADGTVFFRYQPGTRGIELAQVPIDGSAPMERLGPALPMARNVQSDFVVSPDGERVFFRADLEVDEQFELYTLRLAPRTPRGPASSAAPTGSVTRQL